MSVTTVSIVKLIKCVCVSVSDTDPRVLTEPNGIDETQSPLLCSLVCEQDHCERQEMF